MASDDELISIPFKTVVYVVAGLPSFALFICIIFSIALHWDEATRTHCGVTNWLPSVSAAVADFTPERYIWRLFIALHGTPRLAIAWAFSLLSSFYSSFSDEECYIYEANAFQYGIKQAAWNRYQIKDDRERQPGMSMNLLTTSPLRPYSGLAWFTAAVNIAFVINILENIFLLLLTSISSVDDYWLHKSSFIGFISCAMIYMYLSTWLFDYSGRRRTTSLGEKSFQHKVLCAAVSTISIFLAMYFFYRHNTYCEPGVYTLFALSEYAIVIFNILFHSTLYFDFHGKRFTLLSSGATYHYEALPLHNPYTEKRNG